MKVIIFGSNGMLGNYVRSYLQKKNINTTNLTRINYNLNNLSFVSLDRILQSNNINSDCIVINCAGIIPQSSKQRILDDKLYYTIKYKHIKQ